MELYDATDTNLLAYAVTNDNGNYGFAGLDPDGSYTVKVDTTGILAGLTNIEDPQGAADSESIVDLSTGTGIDLDQDFWLRRSKRYLRSCVARSRCRRHSRRH